MKVYDLLSKLNGVKYSIKGHRTGKEVEVGDIGYSLHYYRSEYNDYEVYGIRINPHRLEVEIEIHTKDDEKIEREMYKRFEIDHAIREWYKHLKDFNTILYGIEDIDIDGIIFRDVYDRKFIEQVTEYTKRYSRTFQSFVKIEDIYPTFEVIFDECKFKGNTTIKKHALKIY